jgi:L-fucose mutarotase
MLIGINPLLGGDLLKILDEMGHGNELVLVDRNFPAVATGRPVIRLGGVTIGQAASAILSVFPLDTFIDHPVERMEADNDPTIVPDAATELLQIARASHGSSLEFGVVPRFDFYDRASAAFAVVQTLDDRPYGDFILHKGVV